MFKYLSYIFSILLLFLIVDACQTADKKVSKETIKPVDSITKTVDAKKSKQQQLVKTDSIKNLKPSRDFFKDSCIIYGRIGVDYNLLGRPRFKDDPPWPTRKDFVKNKIFKIEFYPYLKKDLIKTIITGKDEHYRYRIKLKKHKSYEIVLYYKKTGDTIWHKVKDQFMSTNFRTSKRDTAQFDIKKVYHVS